MIKQKEEKNLIVGLDIGTSKIVTIVSEIKNDGEIQILGIGQHVSRGLKKGVVVNIESTMQAIQRSLEEAELMADCKIKEVYTGIAGSHIRSINSTGMVKIRDLEVDNSDVERVIETAQAITLPPDQQVLHTLVQEYIIDDQYDIREPRGMSGMRLEVKVHIVSGAIAAAQNIVKCIKRSGLDVMELILQPLASADAVLTNDEKELGVCLIDIGGGTTDLAIFKDGIIRHTAVIPFGGNIITDDIKEGCSIIEKQAELLKIKFGSAWPGENKENEIVSIPGLRGRDPKEITLKNLSKIINARIVEIIEQVFIEIKNYGHDEQKKKLIAGIVLTGGGSQLNHLKQTVEYVTGMDTRIGQPNEHLAGNNSIEISNPTFATAVGLVMNSMNRKKIDKKDYDKNQDESSDEESVTNN